MVVAFVITKSNSCEIAIARSYCGYQGVGSIGRLLQDGAKQVWIDGMDVRVERRSQLFVVLGHADRNQLVDLVYRGTQKSPTSVCHDGGGSAHSF